MAVNDRKQGFLALNEAVDADYWQKQEIITITALLVNDNDNMNEEKLRKGINEEEVDILPVNTLVLIKFYEDEPYKAIETTSNGLIIGIESTHKYKSNETGEMEEDIQITACAKVLAVGPECKNVKVGEDIFVPKSFCKPIPFRKKGFYLIAEQSVLCRIVPKPRPAKSLQEAEMLDPDIYSKDYIEFKNKENKNV